MATNRASTNWNQETKARLNEKITSNVNDLGSLTRQVIRGSKSNEETGEVTLNDSGESTELHKAFAGQYQFLAQAAKNFASQENYIHNSHETMRKMDLIRSQLEFQQSAIARSLSHLDEIQDQIASIRH